MSQVERDREVIQSLLPRDQTRMAVRAFEGWRFELRSGRHVGEPGWLAVHEKTRYAALHADTLLGLLDWIDEKEAQGDLLRQQAMAKMIPAWVNKYGVYSDGTPCGWQPCWLISTHEDQNGRVLIACDDDHRAGTPRGPDGSLAIERVERYQVRIRRTPIPLLDPEQKSNLPDAAKARGDALATTEN